MGACEGDCDNDSECADDLICFQRYAHEVVTGCVVAGVSGRDYCYTLNPGNPTLYLNGNFSYVDTFNRKYARQVSEWGSCIDQ